MPQKGFFTQSAVVLLRSTPSVGAIEDALARFPLAGRLAVVDGENGWMGGYPGVLVAFRPDVNGLVMVDVVPTRWPDAMGSPETEPELFAAWSLGWFGPFVYPGNLARAIHWAGDLDAPADLVRSHTAFLRVKSTYALGAGDDSALIPAGYDALAELRFVTEMARALLELPEALTYFRPRRSGETPVGRTEGSRRPVGPHEVGRGAGGPVHAERSGLLNRCARPARSIA